MSTTLFTAPSAEPISVLDARAHLRLDGNDDALVTRLIVAARSHAETFTRRAFLTQTWDLFRDMFADVIELPFAPLQSVSSVKYIDSDGAQQTLATSTYTVDIDSEPGRIFLAWGKSWPSIRAVRNAVEIRFVAGYGSTSKVPDPIKSAILLHVGHLYENREASIVGVSATSVPMGWRSLLWPYRVEI